MYCLCGTNWPNWDNSFTLNLFLQNGTFLCLIKKHKSNFLTQIAAVRDVTYYTTTFSLKCETLLFDLRQNTLIAEAIDTFSKTETRKDEHWFKNKTFLGTVEDIFDSGPNDSRYPDIRFLDAADFWSYFKKFLKNIGKK